MWKRKSKTRIGSSAHCLNYKNIMANTAKLPASMTRKSKVILENIFIERCNTQRIIKTNQPTNSVAL